MMLFDEKEIPRHKVKEHKPKSRFNPIRDGKPTLVMIDLNKDEYGAVEYKKSRIVTSVGFKCTIAEGKQKGRRFWDKFTISGHADSADTTKQNLIAMLMCHGIDASDPRVEQVDGLIVPAVILQKPHWETGKIMNVVHALNPHPDHWDADDFHSLVSRIMVPDSKGNIKKTVPGWDFSEGSKVHKLVQRRISERIEKTYSGLTVHAHRIKKNSERAVDKLSLGLA